MAQANYGEKEMLNSTSELLYNLFPHKGEKALLAYNNAQIETFRGIPADATIHQNTQNFTVFSVGPWFHEYNKQLGVVKVWCV